MKRVVGVLLLVTACGPAVRTRGPYSVINGDPHATPVAPLRSPEEWNEAREWIAGARSELPQKPYVERIRLSVVDPRTRRAVQVRGAVAIDPQHAARLILVGPGGGTALDAWVTPDQYRVEIPALHLVRRGGRDLGADPQATLGLPVGFLRWWFLAPLGGRLIDAETVLSDDQRIASVVRLHEPDATVQLWRDRRRVLAMRRSNGRVEGVEWRSTSLAPVAGIRALYINEDLGLRADVYIEEVMPTEPEPAAFVDPDREGT